MEKLKKYFPILFLIVFIGITYRFWLFDFGIAAAGDWNYLHKSTLLSIYQELPWSIWLPNNTFGAVSVYVGYYPTLYLYGILANFLDFRHIERIVHLWPIVIVTPISIYTLLSSKTKNSFARVIGTLTYTLSSYFLVIQTGQLPLMVGFSLIPLIFYFYEKLLEQKKIFHAYTTSIVLFIQTLYEPRVTFITLIILFIYLVFWIATNSKQKIKTILKGILPVILTAFFNSYWILPLQLSTGISENETLQRGLFGNEFLNITNALTTSHPFWTGENLTIFQRSDIHPIFWILPIIAILALLKNRQNKTVLFYFVLALVGITLTKQAGEPFSAIYEWFFNNLPGFQAFREATKFFPITTLAFSVLITIYIGQKNTKKYYQYPIIALLVIYIFLQAIPLTTGKIGNLFQEQTIPTDYTKIENLLTNNHNYSRHLWIPETTIWSPDSLIHPRVNANKITDSDNKVSLLQSKDFENLLVKHSIQYIILDKSKDNYSDYEKELKTKEYLIKKDYDLENLSIYENIKFNNLLQTEVGETLTYEQVHPTLYTIKKRDEKMDIYFSENYDPGWKLVQKNSNWYDIVTKSEQKIEGEKTKDGLILFKGIKGSEATIFFEPQKFFILGALISSLIAIYTIIMLTLSKRKNL